MRISRFVAVVAALAAMGLAAVHLRARTTRMGYELVRQRARQRQLQEERARLRFELGRLKAPDRIIERAQRLNLVPVPPVRSGPPRTARLNRR